MLVCSNELFSCDACGHVTAVQRCCVSRVAQSERSRARSSRADHVGTSITPLAATVARPSTHHTPHSAAPRQRHTALRTRHSALSTQHQALSTQHSAAALSSSTQHSALSTRHAARSTKHSALSTCPIHTYPSTRARTRTRITSPAGKKHKKVLEHISLLERIQPAP